MNQSVKTTTISALGIDIGFFSTKYTTQPRGDHGSKITVHQFPSLAPRISGSTRNLPGVDQLDGVVIEVEPGVRHFIGKDVYHTLKTSGTRAVTPDYSFTSDYKALFLAALFHVARDLTTSNNLVIETLVTGLPLSTVYTHSQALKTLISGNHTIPNPMDTSTSITVNVRNAMVIAQPQGALIARGFGAVANSRADFNTLVLDMGGGTFDWFVAKGVRPNRTLCSAVAIGALACAAAICDEIKPDLKDNPEIMGRVDRALRESAETMTISGVTYQMCKFTSVVRRVLDDAIEQMRKSVGSLDGIDQILVTGGGAKLMFKALADALPQYKHLLEMDSEPIGSNVRGFHILAEYQLGRR